MVQENEIIKLILFSVVLLFGLINRNNLNDFPEVKHIKASFILLFTGIIFTILEGYFFETQFNFLEHLFYLFSSCVLLLWVVKTIKTAEKL